MLGVYSSLKEVRKCGGVDITENGSQKQKPNTSACVSTVNTSNGDKFSNMVGGEVKSSQ